MLALLPTGFGKSLVFQVFAAVKLLETPTSNGCFLVICQFKNIISDQIEESNSGELQSSICLAIMFQIFVYSPFTAMRLSLCIGSGFSEARGADS